MVRRFVVASMLLTAGLLARGGYADDKNPGDEKTEQKALSAADKRFIEDAAQAGKAEVTIGQLAAERASSDEVKTFAKRMVDDHKKFNDELKKLAEQKGVTLPDKLSNTEKAAEEHLSGLSGDKFDRAYLDHMISDHKKDVAEFKKMAQTAQDPDLKAWASKTVTTLEDHLRQAEALKKGHGGGKPT